MTTESRAWAGRLGNRDRAGPFQATVLRAPATRARNGPRPSSSVMIGRRARRPLDAAQTGPCTPHDRRPPLGPHWHVPIQLKTRTRTCHDCLLCSVILWLGAGPGRSRPGGTSTSTGSHHPESILPTDWPLSAGLRLVNRHGMDPGAGPPAAGAASSAAAAVPLSHGTPSQP